MKEGLPELSHSRLLLWLIAAFVLAALIWAANAQLDELVRGEGRVIPSRKVQMVQNLEGGIVSEIMVTEGSLVEKDQVILRIDDTQFASTYQDNQLKALALQARVERLRAEVAGQAELTFSAELTEKLPKLTQEELALFASRKNIVESNLRIADQQWKQTQQLLESARFNAKQAQSEQKLAQKERDILKPLLTEGLVSELEFLQAEKKLLTAQGDAQRLQLKLPEIEAELEAAKDKRTLPLSEFKSTAQEELNQTLAELDRVSNTEGALRDRVTRTLVRSPVKGTVKQLLVNTIGGVVQPGMDMVSIVPIEDSLLIETRIKPSDIARLHPGLKAIVKLSAYDYSIYGGLESEVEQISADSLVNQQGESMYLVTVRTKQNFLSRGGQTLPIIPGMVAQVDIITGKKTVLQYLLRPINRVASVALTEP